MAITLAHEMAHVFGMDDIYNVPAMGHDDTNYTCVMKHYIFEQADDFYRDIVNDNEDALCDSCVEALWLSLHSLDLTV